MFKIFFCITCCIFSRFKISKINPQGADTTLSIGGGTCAWGVPRCGWLSMARRGGHPRTLLMIDLVPNVVGPLKYCRDPTSPGSTSRGFLFPVFKRKSGTKVSFS